MMTQRKRGIVKIKPVYVGIYHYNYCYGSVCSPDIKGTPPVKRLDPKEIEKRAYKMVEKFKKNLNLDFVEIDKPFIITEHRHVRELASELTYDTDAILQGNLGGTPLIDYTLKLYALPIIRKPDPLVLRALRVKKFLKESKFLYIGEIPSFSAPNGPWDFFKVQKRFGIRFKHIDSGEFFKVFDSFNKDEVKKELVKWKESFEEILEPTEDDLLEATKVYLTLKYLLKREDANAVTVNCGRFTEVRPVVPCLAFNRLIDEGYVCGCEGDITALLSSLILHSVSGNSVMMGNFGYRPGMFEAREGEVTIEHDIVPLSMTTRKFTIRDYHGRRFGVTGFAPIKPDQPVTLFNMDSSLEEATAIEGKVKESFDGIHCRIIVRISVDGDVEKIPEILVGSQHISMTFGHWLKELKEVGKLLNIKINHL